MNQFEFTKEVINILEQKLKNLCPEGFDSSKPPLERTTHFYSFFNIVFKSIFNQTPAGLILTDLSIAGYKIDDSHEFIESKEFMQSERNRLIDDLKNTTDILNFIATKFRFS